MLLFLLFPVTQFMLKAFAPQKLFSCHCPPRLLRVFRRQWEDAEIMVLLQVMYTDLDFTASFNIEAEVLQNFLFEVYRRYNNIPFHNFKHCFCVTQMVSECVRGLTPHQDKLWRALKLANSCLLRALQPPESSLDQSEATQHWEWKAGGTCGSIQKIKMD